MCYLYIRGLSMLSHSPSARARKGQSTRKRARPTSANLSVRDEGGKKRARYWFGAKTEFEDDGWGDGDDDDEEPSETIEEPGDDEVDAEQALGASDGGSFHDLSDDDDDDSDVEVEAYRSRSKVRHMSEHMTETMEV